MLHSGHTLGYCYSVRQSHGWMLLSTSVKRQSVGPRVLSPMIFFGAGYARVRIKVKIIMLVMMYGILNSP